MAQANLDTSNLANRLSLEETEKYLETSLNMTWNIKPSHLI